MPDRKEFEELKVVDGVVQLPATSVRSRIVDLRESINSSYVEMCGLLYAVKKKELWSEWGFETFDKYIEDELGFHYRKAAYLLSTWEALVVNAKVPIEKLRDVQWTKARLIAPLANEKNAAGLLEKAKRMSQDELQSFVRTKRSEDGDAESEKVKRLTFTLIGDQIENVIQALEIAQQSTGSEKAGHQLNMICLEYNASQNTKHDLRYWIHHLQEVFGCRLIAVAGDSAKTTEGVVEALEKALEQARKNVS